MNKLKYIFAAFFALFLFGGCLDNYKELNTDSELLVTVNPKSAFTGATENFNNSSRQHLLGKYRGVMQYMQYIVNAGGAQEGAYVNTIKNTRPSPYTPYYNDYYEQIGLRLRYLVNKVIPMNNEKERYQNIAAIANLLEAYQMWLVIDVNGAAPYTEAFKINEGVRTPKYDLFQKDINGKELYKVLDAKIKESVEVLQKKLPNQYSLDKNDYFYAGDVAKWIKFGNTVRIKMAQRMEKADKSFYQSVLTEALGNTGGIISGNAESCIYNHQNEHNNNTDDMQNLTTDYCASRALVNFLKTYDDPRLPLLVRRNGFGKGNNNKENDAIADSLAKYFPNYETKFPQWTGRYVGMAANPDSTNSLWSTDGYFTLNYKDDKGVAKTMTVRNNSQIESRFYVKNGGKVGNTLGVRDKEDQDKYDVSQNSISLFTPLITYPEVCFMMAEIAFKEGSAKGGKDALAWFRAGIKASMEQYQAWAEKMGVPAAMNKTSDNYNPITSSKIDTYLARPEFQSVSLEKIVTQQWVNLFMRPEEAWATWKRTGLPAFKNQPVPENGVAFLEVLASGGDKLQVPRRCVLPIPNSENKDNYTEAIKQLVADPNYGADENKTDGRIWWDKP